MSASPSAAIDGECVDDTRMSLEHPTSRVAAIFEPGSVTDHHSLAFLV